MEPAFVVPGVVAAAAAALAAVLVRRARSRLAEEHARLAAQRETADERDERLARREQTLDAMLSAVRDREATAGKRESKAARLLAEARERAARHTKALERTAGMTVDQARRELLEQEEAEVRRHSARVAADIETEAREHAEQRARDVICTAVQRLALSTASPATTVQVPLSDAAMKGRVVGKAGRNIRAFEERTGVNVVVDEVPDAVLLSCFDPRRREIARLALTELVADGWIQPSHIEEHVARAEERVNVEMRRAAREAAAEARVTDLHPELIELLGELYLRTSYGQNALQHSVEVAHLAALMAVELGLDADLARRAGLLHDIGKAAGSEQEASHARVGARLAAQFGQSIEVCHAIEAHHGEVEPMTGEAVLVQAADTISLSRPGGRREHLEQHLTRVREIEKLCMGFEGVVKVHAMQSGRDLRVMVSPERVGDADTRELARRIAARVEKELPFQSRIAVTVIRELRATEEIVR